MKTDAPSSPLDKAKTVTITYLEQNERPVLPTVAAPHGKVALMRVENPSARYYRYLYDNVGSEYQWVSRRGLTDVQLEALIQRPDVYVYVLYIDGAPAGFAELDAIEKPTITLKFFGVLPEWVGKGISRFFLTQIVELAWGLAPQRLALETCTLDHPAALPLYQKFGFSVCGRRTGVPMPA